MNTTILSILANKDHYNTTLHSNQGTTKLSIIAIKNITLLYVIATNEHCITILLKATKEHYITIYHIYQ